MSREKETMITIAAHLAAGVVDVEQPLEEQARAAMRVTKEFWMTTDEDVRFRGAIGALLLANKENDEVTGRIETEMRVLGSFSALISGLPIDPSRVVARGLRGSRVSRALEADRRSDMRHTVFEKKEVVFERVVARECDLCHYKHPAGEFPGEGDHINEVTVSYRWGVTYSDGSHGEELAVDICPTCFRKRLIPWLKEQGATIKGDTWGTGMYG